MTRIQKFGFAMIVTGAVVVPIMDAISDKIVDIKISLRYYEAGRIADDQIRVKIKNGDYNNDPTHEQMHLDYKIAKMEAFFEK